MTPCSLVDLPATLQSSTSQMTGEKVNARVSLDIKKIIKKENMHAQHNKHNSSASIYKGHTVYNTHTHTYTLMPTHKHKHTHTYTHTHTHTNTHIQTPTHTHIQAASRK